MPPSHPPSLRARVRRELVHPARLPSGAILLLALSGGRDSMALLHVLAGLRGELGFGLEALGVDHGLRAAAGGELDRAADFCSELGVGFSRVRLSLPEGGNLQARAREARYAALERRLDRLARGAPAFLVTAHHALDRAETVLLRLLRGTSLEGLAVLPPRCGNRLRPMIRASRTEIDAHLARHAIRWSDDPSNGEARFLRVRVRRELLPLLEELSPGVTAHLTSLADDAAALEEPLGLSREQRSQLRLALREKGRRIDLALPAGLRLRRE